jgi:hypothetical protein
LTVRKFTNTGQDPDTHRVTSHSADMLSIGHSSVNYPFTYQYYKLVCRTTSWHNIWEPIHLNQKILQISISPYLRDKFWNVLRKISARGDTTVSNLDSHLFSTADILLCFRNCKV